MALEVISCEPEPVLLLTVVQFVIRECIHVELPHISRAIDDFVMELPRDWSVEDAYRKTRSLRCIQYLSARESGVLQASYHAWIVNNVGEMTVRNGDVEALKWLVERYAPVPSMTTTAAVAAAEGQLDVLQWLYLNHKDRVHWGGAEWCAAVLSGHKSVVEWLRAHVKPHVETAPQLLLDAASAGDLDIVQWLHKSYGLPVSNALVEAQQGRQWGIVKWILMLEEVVDPEVDANIIAEDGNLDFLQWVYAQGFGRPTPRALEVAAFNDHPNVLEWLHFGPPKLELSPSVFREAARGDNLEVVKWLDEHQCPVTSAAIEAAAENGFLEVVKWISINRKEPCTSRALDRAARNGHLDVVKWLLATGKRFYCPAAINRAAEFGHLDVVKWLHFNRTEGCSAEALDCACHHGHLEVAKWLHANRGEGCGKWALDLAAACGHLEVVKWLHQDLHQPCTTWAMDNAARQGHLDVVKWLHSHRTEGCTVEAMSAAAANGHLDVVRWLHRNRTEGCDSSALNRAIAGGHFDVVLFLHRESELSCSLRSDVSLRGLRLELVQWLLVTCRDELEDGIKIQVPRSDWHFNDWMRSQHLQVVSQDDSNVLWKWSSRL